MPYQPFKIPFGEHALAGDLLSNDSEAQTLVLHGAGDNGRLRTRFIREWFFRHGISSCAFDFIGHGETGGEIKQTSLYERTLQACEIVDHQNIRLPLHIVATSMGAYTAIKLVEQYPVETMVLIVPAMYAASAYRCTFGGGFTEIIRKPESWLESDAWRILTGYTGRLFVVAAEKDSVIPDSVIRNIYDAARNTRERVLYTVADAPHFVFTYLRKENPSELTALMTRVIDMLKK